MADDQASADLDGGSAGAGEVAREDASAPGASEDPPGPARRWPLVLLVLVALLVGAVAGWSVRALTAPTPAPAPSPVPSVAAAPGVPCQAAADAGAAIQAQLDRAVVALRDFDPRTLQEVLDEVQQQQARLDAALAACRAGPAPSEPGPR